MKLSKITAFLLLFSLLSSLIGCNNTTSDTSITEDTNSVTEAVTDDVFVMPDFTKEPSPLSIDGKEVSYTEYRYYFYSAMYKYDNGDEKYWESASDEIKSKVKEDTLSMLREVYGMVSLAEKYGVKLEEKELTEINSQIQAVRDQYELDTENKFNRYLNNLYLTQELNLKLAKEYYLRQKLFLYLIGSDSGYVIGSQDDLIRRFIDNYLIHADRIFISNDYGDDAEENKAIIDSVVKQLADGTDFDTLRRKYSEDTSTNTHNDGLYFMEGDVDDEYFKAASSLKEGETSEMLETPNGYMIVKRLAFDEEYIEENLMSVFLEIYQDHMYQFDIKKQIEKQNIVYSDSYNSITPETVK